MKPKTKLSETDNLVMMSFGYYGRYILPVAVATECMKLLIEGGAVAVEGTSDAGKTVYAPIYNNIRLEGVDHTYLSDCPMDTDRRREYLDWLNTKSTLVGKGYALESYTDYLNQKAGE